MIVIARGAMPPVLHTIIHGMGYAVVHLEDADVLTARLQEGDADLVLLDPRLPNLNCAAFLDHWQRDPQSVPVLLITDDADDDEALRYLDQGALDWLTLDSPLAVMRARIRNCLGELRLRDDSILNTRDAFELARDIREHVLPFGIRLASLDAEALIDLLAIILEEMHSLTDTDAAGIYLVREDDGIELMVADIASRGVRFGGRDGTDIDLWIDPTMRLEALAGTAVQSGTIQMITPDADPQATRMGVFSDALLADYDVVSALAIPLKDRDGRAIAILEMINARNARTGRLRAFDAGARLAVEALGSQAAAAIANYYLMERQRALVKLETDLRVGRDVQMSFLPKALLQPKGWQMASRFQPAREVSGDFYDAFEIRRDMIGIIVADVCDKGVPAALYMALSRSMLRAFAQQHYSLSWAGALFDEKNSGDVGMQIDKTPLREGIARANNYLVRNHGELTMFATTFFGVLNTRTGRVLYVNCGHNPPLVLDDRGSVRARLKPTAPAIGIFEDMPFTIGSETLASGETLFMFTDGVVEARDIDRAFFTEPRLHTLIETDPPHDAEVLVDRVEQALSDFIGDAVQFDDITMMAVRRT